MNKSSETISPSTQGILIRVVGAIGVVFGDLGTSPLYALRECFAGSQQMAVTEPAVFGVVSIMFWAIVIVVCGKYALFMMRFDNRNEGGVLAMMTLVDRTRFRHSQSHQIIILLGVLGASLLVGDGVITPAISVLSAVEGLNVATPVFRPFVVPLSVAILTLLFIFQWRGTQRLGAFFGPILVLWFATLALLGARAIVWYPAILNALNPAWAVRFILQNPAQCFLLLGTIFLTLTGAEVLYADMGHFGKKPIRVAWYGLVFPSLVLNYLGQGAFLLRNGSAPQNLFFHLAPPNFLYPLVILATAATVIASQAVISGTFSLARQSVQLGLWPRLRVIHTSSRIIGQVYVPSVNAGLFICTVGLVLVFGHSSRLASAYGIAVSTAMLITSILLIIYLATRGVDKHRLWYWSAAILFFVVHFVFFLSNIAKIPSGGWIAVAISGALYAAMSTWHRGRAVLRAQVEDQALGLNLFVDDVKHNPPQRVDGTAVFLSASPAGTPRSLLHNVKHNHVLHEKTVILCVITEEVPFVPGVERVRVTDAGQGLVQVGLRYGFSETPNIPKALAQGMGLSEENLAMSVTYFLGKETLVISSTDRSMALWRQRLFVFMARNALDASTFFALPPNRVVELGVQVSL